MAMVESAVVLAKPASVVSGKTTPRKLTEERGQVEKKTESKKASVESKESNAGKDSKRLEKEKLAEGKISQKISTKSDDKIVKVSEMKLAFSVDKETDRVIVKVLDAESGEEIRQIPSDEVVAIARRLEQSKGRILDHTV